jgi:DNA-binding NtrC family response regulator
LLRVQKEARVSLTQSAHVVILDLSRAGSIGAHLRDLLARSADHDDETRLEVLLIHQSSFDETFLAEFVSANIPDLALIVLPPELYSRSSQILTLLKASFGPAPLVAVRETADPKTMFSFLQQGPSEFIASPVDGINFLPSIWQLLGNRMDGGQLRRESRTVGVRPMLGQSSVWTEQMKKIPLIAQCDANVLINGETGTGKELCARAIHYTSLRAGMPFVAVNCGAIPESLIENELFGHAKGAFTDAAAAEVGLLEQADGGTLFLDEIDCLTAKAQVKLLRFIQEKEYRPLGSTKTSYADVRIVAATNIDLDEALLSGKIRRDFYYRVSVVPVSLPPLRERREDIALLARHFLKKHAVRLRRPANDFTSSAVRVLELYNWPGNVRELEHIIERAVIFSATELIDSTDLSLQSPPSEFIAESFKRAKARTVDQFEKCYIEKLLLDCKGNISKAARLAQKNRRAFWELMRKHHIRIP